MPMIIKNSLVILAVVAVLALSQQPAEAGPIKRGVLRAVKWGGCFPLRWGSLVHILPGYLLFVAGGVGEIAIDEMLINDRYKDAAKKEDKSLIHQSGYDVPINAEPAEEPVAEESVKAGDE